MFRWSTSPTPPRPRPQPRPGSGAARRLAVAAGAALLALPTGAGAALDRADLVRVGASVLKIEAQRRQGGYALGSGVVVGAGLVVTNCHVTRDAVAVFVSRGAERADADAQAADPARDLCVLRVPGLRAEAVALGSAAGLRPAQPVTALGYTGGAGLQASAGEVIALHRHDGSQVIQSSNWFSSGASGGGLFDDDRRLVGVLTFRLRGGAAHYFAAPVDWVRPLAGDHQRFRRIAPLGAAPQAYWQRPLELQPKFLKAAWLERDGRWNDLALLGASWSDDDAADPEGWYVRGIALAELGLERDARDALERSVSIDPDYAIAWYRLGALSVRARELARARDVQGRLQRLNPGLAAQLGRMIADAS